MLGSPNEKPDFASGYFKPVIKHGISLISMGHLLDEKSPVIWRAPMAMKMIQQFLSQVEWGKLDYLLIDLPPGTGDVQLTLAQSAQLSGALIVTTPQEVALGVARKGLKMFQQVNVPILGVVENMSGFICSHCEKETAIFSQGGGKKLAEEFDVPLLGSLPLDPAIMTSGDSGRPLLMEENNSPGAVAFGQLAKAFDERVDHVESKISASEPLSIKKDSENNLIISWPDGHQSKHSGYYLRINCACAQCIEEHTGRKLLDPKRVPLDIKATQMHPVGRYGLAVAFSDGHNTGIYAFNRLRSLCECENCKEGKVDQESFSI
jgi:ATP-binding protein involved in chromosome partitioning